MFTFLMYGHTLEHMSARVRALTRVHTHTYTHSRDAAGEQSQRDSEESEEIMGAPLTRADSKSIDLQMLPRGQGHKADLEFMFPALFPKPGTQAFAADSPVSKRTYYLL